MCQNELWVGNMVSILLHFYPVPKMHTNRRPRIHTGIHESENTGTGPHFQPLALMMTKQGIKGTPPSGVNTAQWHPNGGWPQNQMESKTVVSTDKT